MPVFTYLLSPADYGIINIFTANVELAAVLLSLNGGTGIGRYYFELEKTDYKSLLFSSLVFSFSLLLIFGIVLSWSSRFFADFLDLPEGVVHYIVPSAVLILMSKYLLGVFRASGQSKEIRNFGILKTYVQFILTVGIILLLESDLYFGKIYSGVFASAVFGGYALFKLRSYIRMEFDFKKLSYLLSYALPLLPAFLGTLLLSYFDRIMLNSMVSQKSAGLYSFAYNIAGLQYMVSSAIMNGWVPKYYKQMNEKNFDVLDKQGVQLFKIIGLATLGLVAFGQYIGMVLGSKSYHEGLNIVPVVIVGQFFMTMAVIYKYSISYSKKTILSTIAILISAGLNVGLNYIFIPRYGMVAASWTTLVSYFTQAVFTIILVRKLLKVHSLEPKKIVPTIFYIVIGSLVLGGFYYLELGYFLDILFRTLLVLLVGALLFRYEINSFLNQFKISK